MKRFIPAICVASLLMFSNTAFAQGIRLFSFSGNGTGVGIFGIEQSDDMIVCHVRIPFNSDYWRVRSVTGANLTNRVPFCDGLGDNLNMTQEWVITYDSLAAISQPIEQVLIGGITLNSPLGRCETGLAPVKAEVASRGPPLILHIPEQMIGGWIPSFPLVANRPCYIWGTIEIYGVSLVVQTPPPLN